MGNNYYKLYKWTFITTLAASIMLIIVSFCLPPTGAIDPSVLTASGELLAFATLAQVPHLISRGKGIKTKIGDKVEIEVDGEDDNDNELN